MRVKHPFRGTNILVFVTVAWAIVGCGTASSQTTDAVGGSPPGGVAVMLGLDDTLQVIPLEASQPCSPEKQATGAAGAGDESSDRPQCNGSILAGGPVSDVRECWEACDCVYEGCTASKSGAECVAEERQWRTCKNSCCRRASPEDMSTSEDAFCRGGF